MELEREPGSEEVSATEGSTEDPRAPHVLDRRMSRRRMLAGGLTAAGVAAGIGALGSAPAMAATLRRPQASRKFKIALANSYIGNTWRIEMENVLKAAALMPPYKHLLDLTVYNAPTTSNSAQASQMSDMIASGFDAILIDAASATGLNGVITEATKRGIIVVAFDNNVTAPSAAQIQVNQLFFGQTWANFLVKKLNGKGNVIMVTGVAGAEANVLRNQGGMEVFAKHPGIKVVTTYSGQWSTPKAQEATTSVLPSLPHIDGIWCQGGTDGVLNAFAEAGRPLPFTAGEAENGFRLYMAGAGGPKHDLSVDGISVGQPPYLSVAALELARRLLQKVPGQSTSVTLDAPVFLSSQVKVGNGAYPNLPDDFYDSYTGVGAGATLIMCLNAALHGTPCPGTLTVNIPK
ncbi:MAG TPA: substrate-binding domain-containing protein [Acidimicrobiales bacterium]|nr:substrate-binding domain-containing protein [Acidimicrobiales bacterium]